MSASDGSSNALNDAIIRLYLYGNAQELSNLLNESVIRDYPIYYGDRFNRVQTLTGERSGRGGHCRQAHDIKEQALAEQEKSYISSLVESCRPAHNARHKGPASAQDLQANRDGAVTCGKLVNCYRNSGAIGFTQRAQSFAEAQRHKEFTMVPPEFFEWPP
jgi:hypothetical protein